MSEALDTIESFKRLLEDSRIKQAQLAQAEDRVKELSSEIQKLEAEKAHILAEIEAVGQENLLKIKTAKDNADRVFAQEDRRITKQNEGLDIREAVITKKEAALSQKHNELLAWEEKLISLQAKLEHQEVEIKTKKLELTKQQEENNLLLLKINADRRVIDKERKDIVTFQKDIKESLVSLEQVRKEHSDNEIKLAEEKAGLEKDKKELKAERQAFKNECFNLDKKIKEDKANIDILKEIRKNNDDKERALNALQVEIDFKIAKLESIKK